MACILGFTVSTAARQAAWGVSMPSRATSMALRRISAFSVRVGGDVQAAVGADEQPVQAGDLQNDQVAGQAADVQAGPARSRACLSRVPVDTVPFMRIWFSPLRMDSMAASMAWGRIPDVRQLHRSGVQLHLLQQGQHALHVAEKLGAARPEARASFTASRVFLS